MLLQEKVNKETQANILGPFTSFLPKLAGRGYWILKSNLHALELGGGERARGRTWH
jgi:hypothetical protein